MHATLFRSKELAQLNPETGEVNVSPIPNGESPTDIVAIPASTGSTTTALVFASLGPTFDSGPQRAEIAKPAEVPKPLLTVTKESIETLTRDPFGIGINRTGGSVKFKVTVKNSGQGSTTGPWKLIDRPPLGDTCFSSDLLPDFTYTGDVTARPFELTITPKPENPNFVLQKEQTVTFIISCSMGLSGKTGETVNNVEVSGGGSETTTDRETVILIDKEAAERIEEAKLKAKSKQGRAPGT